MSAQQLITEHIDLWTSTVKAKNTQGRGSSKKRELYGIKKLRELILELAVRGKLIPQDPNDEPASVLLELIAAEKEQLIKEGKINKQKPLLDIGDNEKSFDLPIGWEWVQFGLIAEIERGGSPRPIKSFITDEPDGLNWIKIGDTEQGGKYITSTNEKIRKEGLSKTRMVYPGDFLLTNSMSFGRPYITKIEGCIHDGWLRISPPSSLDKDYLYLLLSSPFIVNAFKRAAAGAVVLNLNAEKVRDVVILIPPFKEQHRIVAKVDELMALCDQLEQQTESSLDAHNLLVDTLLSTLTDACDSNELSDNWARLANHFDTLITTDYAVEQLKQTILQLAVMGKLVPQDPNDEPASELLKKIATEKEILIEEGTVKKQKPLPPISAKETLFELPGGWEWIRFGECASLKSGSSFPKERELEFGDIPYCKVGDMNMAENIYTLTTSSRFINPTDKELNQLIPAASIAFPKRGGAIATNKKRYIKGALFVDLNVMAATPFKPMSLSFVMKWLDGIDLASLNTGTSVPQINNKDILPLLFPCPPLSEQHRIVAKVDELMALCDQLKVQLNNAQTTKFNLSDAVVDNALG
jgi:type I restriction enzyme S subunit